MNESYRRKTSRLRSTMTSAQLILVAVTSALVAVTAMLIVATIRRATTRDETLPEKGATDVEQADRKVEPG